MTVSFSFNECGHASIAFPAAFKQLSQRNLTKIFDLMWDSGRGPCGSNLEAIATTACCIDDYIADCQQEWRIASAAFQRGYVDVEFNPLSKQAKRSAKANNDRLYKAVVQAKKAYERAKKIKVIFETRLHIDERK